MVVGGLAATVLVLLFGGTFYRHGEFSADYGWALLPNETRQNDGQNDLSYGAALNFGASHYLAGWARSLGATTQACIWPLG